MAGLDFLLSLRDKFTDTLGKADTALQSLDRQLVKENEALTKVERKAADAAEKLAKIGEGTAIKKLEADLAKAQAKMDGMSAMERRIFPKEYAAASKEVETLSKRLGAAKEKQAGQLAAQEKVVAKLNDQVTAQRASRDAVQNAIPAWQKWSQGLSANKDKLAGLADQAAQAGGPLGSLAGKAKALAQLAGKGGVAGAIVVLVVALVALATAGIVAAVSLARFALTAADAARSSFLLSEAATGAAGGGRELEAVIGQLSGRIPTARDKIAEMARSLTDARLEGRELQLALTTMGIIGAARGDQAASKIKAIAEQSKQARVLLLGARDVYGEFAGLAGTGIKSADLYAGLAASMRTSIPEAKRLVMQGRIPVKQGLEALERAAETKFGKIVALQMMSLETQALKFKENIAALFSGVNIERFLAGLKTITDLFGQNTATGYALREVITKSFSAIFDLASKVFPYVRALLIGVAIAIIVVATYAKRIYNAFNFPSLLDQSSKLKIAFGLGAALVAAFVAAVVGVGVVLAALAVTLAVITAPLWLPWVLAAAAAYATYKAITFVASKITTAFDALKTMDLKAVGADMIQGLIDGISSKIASVTSTITGITDAIKGAFTGEMEIHSPSRVMARYADNTVEGYTGRLEARTPDAQAAIRGLGGARPEAPASGTNGGQQPLFGAMFKDCVFGSDAEETGRVVDERIRAFFLRQAGGVG